MGFRTYFLRASLETNVKSTDLHITGRNMSFELFRERIRAKIGVFSGKKRFEHFPRTNTNLATHSTSR